MRITFKILVSENKTDPANDCDDRVGIFTSAYESRMDKHSRLLDLLIS
jgi:hypothetical protein